MSAAMARHDVIVIGAGLAGLSAAVHLARAGARVLVLEARGRAGGRATSFQDPRTGRWFDNGQHVLLGCYHATFELLDLIGARDGVQMDGRLVVPFVDRQQVRTELRCPPMAAPWGLLAGLARWPAIGWRDRLSTVGLARVVLALGRAAHPEVGAALASEQETVEAWLVRHGQTPRLREMLWDPLALAALNQEPADAAARAFLAVLRGMFSGRAQDAAIALPGVPLLRLFAEPASRYVEARGGTVRLHTPARVVATTDRLVVEARGRRVEAPRVVVAVPWFYLPRVLPSAEQLPDAMRAVVANAASTPWSPIVTVYLWLDRPVLGAPFLGLPGRRLQWAFESTGDVPRLAVVSSGASDIVRMPDARVERIALDELTEACPALGARRILQTLVVREPRATFSVAPGMVARPAARTAVEGLWLAGDWIETGLPSTIESAVLSGRLAARDIMSGASSRERPSGPACPP